MDEQDREKQREANRRSYQKHREERLAKRAAVSEETKRAHREYQRKWREQNRERLLEYDRQRWVERAEQHNARQRELRKLRPKEEQQRIDTESWLRKGYGKTLEWYNETLAKQGGHCALCPAVPKARRLHIDHDHKCCPRNRSCGKCIRGLLCGSCNHMLAFVEDAGWLERAAQYLKSYEKEI